METIIKKITRLETARDKKENEIKSSDIYKSFHSETMKNMYLDQELEWYNSRLRNLFTKYNISNN